MKLEQLTQGMAASLASLFIILTICIFPSQQSDANGERLILARFVSDCPYNTTMFFHLTETEAAQINAERKQTGEGRIHIEKLLKNRTEHVDYFSASENTPVAAIEMMMADLRNNHPGKVFLMITSSHMDRFREVVPPLIPKHEDDNRCFAPPHIDSALFSVPDRKS
jgi:hypothetical protein